MTFEQARAQFPVLERVAYLQAGSAGPLARRTTEAMAAEEERNLREGRVGLEYIDRVLALRAELRAELAGLVGADAEQVALTASTTDGCNLVLAGLDLDPVDEVVTTTDEHFGLHRPTACIRCARGGRSAGCGRDRSGGHAEDAAPRCLPRSLDDRPGAPRARASGADAGFRSSWTERSPWARSRWTPPDSTSSRSRARSGSAGLSRPGRCIVADPERLRVARPSYFSQQGYEPDGAFEPWPGARRFDPNWVPTALMSGLLAAVRLRPEWRFERGADDGRALPRAARDAGEDVVSPDERATIVSWRPRGEASADVVARLAAAGVIVRDIPKIGLVRASVGWWTSDGDLDRLLAGLKS